MVSGELRDAECGIEFLHKGIDLGIHPRKLAKLEGIAHVPETGFATGFPAAPD
jgi:hypothetical protein